MSDRAGELERRRLGETFERLCRIESPSGFEAPLAGEIEGQLGALGVASRRDETGNVFALLPAASDAAREDSHGSLLLCAHMDTVPLAAPVEPVLVDGGWENQNEGILGADNKAAVAVLLELARRYARAPAPVALELLFTVEEERALGGAKQFDVSALRSRVGFVFDHASPIGEIVCASPTYYRLEATLRGASAHAGVRPEDGRSAIVAAARAVAAMRLGRIDPQTTANIGVIGGGDAENVVPEHCVVRGEARSLDAAVAERTVSEMVEQLQDAANIPECCCDLDVVVERLFDGYRMPAGSAAVAIARRALSACGYAPSEIATGGGSDANALLPRGIECVNLANGTERNHQPDERVSVDALEGMLDVGLALVGSAAR
ncbi:MAG: M20/M25/M40 family metallo-hydrolase [Solirubrobacteraceae bacterium]